MDDSTAARIEAARRALDDPNLDDERKRAVRKLIRVAGQCNSLEADVCAMHRRAVISADIAKSILGTANL